LISKTARPRSLWKTKICAYRRRRNQTAKHERHSPAEAGRRGVAFEALSYATLTSRRRHRAAKSGDSTGHPAGKAKEVVRFIKDSKPKVQASIQGEMVRISGKDRVLCSK